MTQKSKLSSVLAWNSLEKNQNQERLKMAAPPPHHSELGELARCLRQERLYVSVFSVICLVANKPCCIDPVLKLL